MGVKVTWLGHAAMGVEIDGIKLLIDPFLSGNPSAAIAQEQTEADYILISHGHGDHVGDAAEIARRTGALLISVFEIANWLEAQGLKVHAQHIGGGHHYPFGYLKLTQALHGSALPDGSYGGNPAGFLITPPGRGKLYFACDTGLFGDMRLIGEEGVALAVLPIGDNYTMGPEDALRAVKLIEPQHVIPIHYSTFDLIKQDAHAWAERVARETSARAYVLKPGESLAID